MITIVKQKCSITNNFEKQIYEISFLTKHQQTNQTAKN